MMRLTLYMFPRFFEMNEKKRIIHEVKKTQMQKIKLKNLYV